MSVSDKKAQLLQIADEENALALEWGLEVYSSRGNVSRALADLVEKEFLIEKEAPQISKYEKLWTLTEKGETFAQYWSTEMAGGV
jgi:DNA-binding MarR family transcriptional regulator